MKTFIIIIIIALALACATEAPAHDGHADAPAAPIANAPQRMGDGSVFLPKLSQRQMAIRTVLAQRKELARTVELNGKVISDPNAGGKVQASFAGRVEAGPHGLPSLGQSVRKGEVLAYIRPTAAPIERANQLAQAAELRANKTLAQQRLARLEQLAGSVPQKDIDAARLELQSVSERLAAVGASVSGVEALAAPNGGVIAATSVVAGQLVDARELLYEIVDPAGLRIEALAYDAQLAANIAGASVSPAAGSTLALDLVGAGRVLREQAIPIQFRLHGDAGKVALLSLGQPLKVLVQTRARLTGVALPAGALVKNAANEDIVWVHSDAQRFVARTVRSAALDGANVVVTDGIAPGERVVVQGASLLNQVR